MIFISEQHITCDVWVNNKVSRISWVYISTDYVLRRQLWADLIQVHTQNTPWVITGNFNAIIGIHEKLAGPSPLGISCDEFTAFSNICDLIHMDTNGAEFTWTNGRQGGGRTNI